MRVKNLKHNPNNPRKITKHKLAMLKAEMEEYGDLSGIIFNKRTNRLIGGHQRTKNFDPEWEIKKQPHKDKTGTVAKGIIVTPYGEWIYREVDWDETKEYAANIAANKQLAEYDIPILKNILQELDINDFDMALTGFDQDEVEDLMTQFGNQEENKEDEEEQQGCSILDKKTITPIEEEYKDLCIKEFINLHDNILIGYSGGKDSTALLLWALDNCDKKKIKCVFVQVLDFPEVIKYLDYIEENLKIKIERIGYDNPLKEWKNICKKYGYPFINNKWCHRDMKKAFIIKWYRNNNYTNINTVYLQGVRREESPRRAKLYDVDRYIADKQHKALPIINWTNKQVCEYIKSKGLKLNQVYYWFDRCSCFGCFMLGSKKYAILRKIWPELYIYVMECLAIAGQTDDIAYKEKFLINDFLKYSRVYEDDFDYNQFAKYRIYT